MFEFKAFNLSVGSVLLRFYLMTAIVLIAGFTGQWWLVSFAFLIFFSAMMGVSMNRRP